MRHHLMANFQYIFERSNTIPIGILIEPLVKQILITESVTFNFNVFDFDFFSCLARHSRLNIKNAVQIADLMAKSYLNENAIEFQNSAGVPFMLVVTRFLDHEAIQEFLVKFVSIAIDTMTALEKSLNAKNAERREKINEFEKVLEEEKKKRPHKRRWPPEKTIAEQVKPPQETSEEIEERAKQLIRRHRCIEIIKQLVQYRNQDLNGEVKDLLLSSLLKFTEENQVESKSICHILDWWWGKPQTLLQEYIEKKKLQEAQMQSDLLAIEYQGIQMNEEDLHMDDKASSEFYENSQTKRSEEQQSKVEKQPYSIMIKDIVRNNQTPATQQISKLQTKISTNQLQKQPPQTQMIAQQNETRMSKFNDQKSANDQRMSIISENKPPRQQKHIKDKKPEKEQPIKPNEFLSIIQNSKQQEKPETLKKKQQEPVRHKFEDLQQIISHQEGQPQKKPSHQRSNIQVFDPTFTDNLSSIQYHSQFKPPQTIKFQPQLQHFQDNKVYKEENAMEKQFKMLQDSLMNQRNFSLPLLNQQATIANYSSAHTIKRGNKRDLSHQDSASRALVPTKTKPKSQLTHLESPQQQVTIDENLYKMLQYQQMLLQQSSKNSKSHAQLNQTQENQLVPFQQKRLVDVPVLRKQPKDKRVLEDIKKINQKKIEKEYKKYIDEQIKVYKDQKQRRSIRQELERRKLELGIAASKDRRNPYVKEALNAALGKSLDDSEDGSTERLRSKQVLDVVILDEGEELPKHKQKIKKLLPPMQLVDINTEEEERDRIDIMLWLQKFNRLFKTLFNKYVSTIRSAMEQTFEAKDQRGKLLNFAEILKFSKDHGIYPDYLSKDEIQSLLRMLSLKRNKKEEVMYLDMESFQSFFIQCSYNIFNFKQNKTHMTLLQQMEELLKVMQKALLYKGENIGLYQDPDYVVGLDKQRLKELNLQLEKDPLIDIPQGFYKVYEKKMHYEYTLPDYLPIKESEKIAAEVLDGFFNDLFGVHILEARGFPTVVPRIKQHENIQVGRHYKNLNEIKDNSRWFSPPQSQQTSVRKVFGRNFSPKRDESMMSYQLMDQKREEFKSIDSHPLIETKTESPKEDVKEEPKEIAKKQNKYLKVKKEKQHVQRKSSTEMVNKYLNPNMKYDDALEVAQCIGDMLDKLDPEVVEEQKTEYSLKEIDDDEEPSPIKGEKEIILQKLDSIVKQPEALNQTKDNSELMQKQLELSRLYKEHSQYQQPVPQRPQIMNRVQAEKMKKKLENEKREFEREVKRLQQDKELKQKITEIHQLREEQVYDQTKKQKQVELIDLENKRRDEEKRKRIFDAKKQAVQEKKLKDLEELQRQKEMEMERKRKESELKAIKQKEFLKNQKDKLKKEFDTRINERRELVKEQEQFKQTEEQLKNEIKSNMVNYIQRTKEDLKQIEERQKQEVNDFFSTQETKQLFKRFERGLKQYYKFYAAQDKQQIEFNLEAKNDTINMNEFVKFGYQSNIYPALITHEDLLQIFRQLVRERYYQKNQSKEEKEKMQSVEVEMLHVIDFDYFKKGLIRIAAMAQDKLLSGNPNQGQQPKGQSRTQSRAFSRRTNRSISSSLNVSTVGSLVRKNKENYLIKQLHEKTPKYGTKIEDKQITKSLKMSSMNQRILEHLLQFLDINEVDNATKVTSKIHNKRIELSGQKPSKVKKEEVKKLASGNGAILQEDQGEQPINQEEENQEEELINQEGK